MSNRPNNNPASVWLYLIYMSGVLSALPWPHLGEEWTWAQAWRAVIWPLYIAWVEVGAYIEAAAKAASQ